MPVPIVRADYDELARIATLFRRQAGQSQRLLSNLTRNLQSLEGGDWVGRGADAFYREMDLEVLPALKRLAAALEQAQHTTAQINAIMQQAEDDAAQLFRLIDGGAPASNSYAAAIAAVPGVESTVPGWVWDFVIALVPFGDAIDIVKQLWNKLRGAKVDQLVLTLALLGIIADLGWLNPFPSVEDAPNAVLAALKALAKQLPPGAAREALEEMAELAVKNADEAARLGEALTALTKNSDLALALTKNPEALVAVLRHGPEAVELLGKFSDDAVGLVGKYGDEGIRILNHADEAAAGAYQIGQAGGRHAGTIGNYAGRPLRELERAARGYDRQVTEHIMKLNNPERFVPDWPNLTPQRQRQILATWEDHIVRNNELAEIMRQLAAEARP